MFCRFPPESGVLPASVSQSFSNNTHSSCRAELEEQVAAQSAAKKRERVATLAEERRNAEAAAEYNPFGRGGCGAPLRDAEGRTITDLNQVPYQGSGPLMCRLQSGM